MVEVQAKSLEEYDLFLEEVKAQLSSKKFSDNENDRDFFTEELQLESMQDEVCHTYKLKCKTCKNRYRARNIG